MNASRDCSSDARRGGALAAVATAALLACGPQARARAPASTPRTALHAAPARAAEPEARALVLPGANGVGIGERIGATGYAVHRGLRAQIEAGRVVLATERLAANVLAATRVDGGWAFVAEDGVVATSASFTGPLRILGTLPTPLESTRFGPGTVAIVDADGAAWLVTGTAGVRRLALPEDARALDVAFADARRGAAALAGGALVRTEDGGTTWAPVELGEDISWQVTQVGDGLAAETTAGRVPIEHTGAAAGEPTREVYRLPLEIGAAGDARLERAMRERFAPVLAWLSADAAPAHDDAVLVLEHRAVVALDGESGEERARHPDVLPDGCSLAPWGRDLVAVCPGAGLFRSDDDGASFAPVPRSDEVIGTVFSDDGQHAVVLTGCPSGHRRRGARAAASALSLCAYHDESSAWRAVPIEPAPSTFYAMHGADVLVGVRAVAGAGDPRATGLAIASSETGAVAPLRLAVDTASARIESAAFASDGTVVALTTPATDASRRALWIGHPGAPLATRALPDGVRSVGFLDALRGVAAGSDGAQLYRTFDGGGTWSRIALAVSGDAAAIALPGDSVECAAPAGLPACLASGVLVPLGRGWGSRLDPVDRVVAGSARPARPVDAHVDSRAVLACRAAPRRAPPVLARSVTRANARSVELARYGAHATLSLRRDPAHRVLARVRWRDDAGAFTGATREVDVAVFEPDADFGTTRTASYSLVGVTPRGVLIARCTDASSRSVACVHYWAQDRGPVVQVEYQGRSVVDGVSNHAVEAVARADGGLLVLAASSFYDGVIDIVLSLDAHGEVVGQRAFAWETGARRIRGLGRLRGEAAYYVTDAPRRDSLSFYPLERDLHAPPERVTLSAQRSLTPCPGAVTAAGDTTFDVPHGGWLPTVQLAPSAPRAAPTVLPDDFHAVIERTADGAVCLRRLERDPDAAHSTGGAVTLRATGAGAMAGAIDRADGAGRDELACAPTP